MREKQRIATSEEQLLKVQKRFKNSFWVMRASFVPLLATTGINIALQEELSEMVGPYTASLAVSLLGVGHLVECGLKFAKEQEVASKRKKTFSEQIAPLTEYSGPVDAKGDDGYFELAFHLQRRLAPISPAVNLLAPPPEPDS